MVKLVVSRDTLWSGGKPRPHQKIYRDKSWSGTSQGKTQESAEISHGQELAKKNWKSVEINRGQAASQGHTRTSIDISRGQGLAKVSSGKEERGQVQGEARSTTGKQI